MIVYTLYIRPCSYEEVACEAKDGLCQSPLVIFELFLGCAGPKVCRFGIALCSSVHWLAQGKD